MSKRKGSVIDPVDDLVRLPADNPLIISGYFVDRCEWVYWDTIFAGQVSPSVAAFSMPRGTFDRSVGQVRTLHDTNMISDGTLHGFGSTRCMIMREMGVYFPLWLSDRNISDLLSTCTLVFSIAEKVFYESRLDFREDQNAGEDVVNTYSDGETEVFHAPVYSRRMVSVRVKEERFAKYIAPLVPFTFRLDFANWPLFDCQANQPIMIPTLTGWTDRAVQ